MIRKESPQPHTKEDNSSLEEKLAQLGININSLGIDATKSIPTVQKLPLRSSPSGDSDCMLSTNSENSWISQRQSADSHPPPPTAFSDNHLIPTAFELGSSSERREVLRDYIDVNRRSSSESTDLSFYSDSHYLRSRSASCTSNPDINRSDRIRHSVISSTSSGVSYNSYNSFEVSLPTSQRNMAAPMSS